MKHVIALIFALTLTACGTDHKDPAAPSMDVTLPYTLEDGKIVTEGAALGYDGCSYNHPAVFTTDGFEPIGNDAYTLTDDSKLVNLYVLADTVVLYLSCN